MSTTENEIPRTFAVLTEQQLQIYANELHQHYREEHRLRRELQSRNKELEQRVNELLCLNQLFQRFMAQLFDPSQTQHGLISNANGPGATAEEISDANSKNPGPEDCQASTDE